MKNALAAAAALVLSATASAAGAPSSSFIDLFYVPQSKLELHDPSFGDLNFDGHNYGVRTMVRMGSAFALTGEFAQGKLENDDIVPFKFDTEAARLGAGVFAPTGSGVYVEWINFKTRDDTGSEDSTPGWGYHGRLAADPATGLHVYGDLAYVQLKDTGFKTQGWEYLGGVAYDVAESVAAFADYRGNNLKDNSNATEKFSDLRFGLRFKFGL